MTTAKLPNLTPCGLAGIDLVPFGLHACHFYRGRDELAGVLAPYFREGLRANERCLWITAPPLPAKDAADVLRAAWDAVDEALQTGALRIVDFDQWYASNEGLKGLEVVELWIAEEERALADGYAGLRISGNMSFLQAEDWAEFMAYEQAVTVRFSGRRIVALCSYDSAQCDGRQADEVMHAHHCALEQPGENWQVVAPPRAVKA